MRALADFFSDALLGALGRPTAVARIVAGTPALRGVLPEAKRTAHISSVPAWHDWRPPSEGAGATLRGWGLMG